MKIEKPDLVFIIIILIIGLILLAFSLLGYINRTLIGDIVMTYGEDVELGDMIYREDDGLYYIAVADSYSYDRLGIAIEPGSAGSQFSNKISPKIHFADDPNTGMYLVWDDNVRVWGTIRKGGTTQRKWEIIK